MKREQCHDFGYWMSVIGFTEVVSSVVFGTMTSLRPGTVTVLAGLGFIVFLLGAEIALRNGKHSYPFHHNEG